MGDESFQWDYREESYSNAGYELGDPADEYDGAGMSRATYSDGWDESAPAYSASPVGGGSSPGGGSGGGEQPAGAEGPGSGDLGSSGEDSGSFGKDAVSSPVHSCGSRPHRAPADTKHWIEVQMVDEDGKPVPGVRYRVKAPDGSVFQGTLDRDGLARVGGLDPGSCDVTFPRLDQDAWTDA